MYALLLFGGPVSVNHIAGGLTVGTKDTYVKLKAWPRIGVLVNQLRYVLASSSSFIHFPAHRSGRRLLDLQLARSVEEGTSIVTSAGGANPVLDAILGLLTGDGLST